MNDNSRGHEGWPDDRAALEAQLTYWRAPEGVVRAYADGPSGQIHYRYSQPEIPERTTVVLLHQTPSSGRCWEGVMNVLGRTRVVIAPDTPGFGDSDGPRDLPSIQDYASAMIAFIDGLSLPRVDLVGDHTGAKIAAEIALQRPRLVRKLVLYGAPVYTEAQREAQLTKLREKRKEAGAPWPLDGGFLTERWAALRAHYESKAPAPLVDRDFAETLRAQRRAWWGYHAAFGYSHADVLPKLTQPLLLLSANDGLWEETHRAAQLVPGAKVIHRAEWQVGAISLQADAVATALCNFLDDEPAREVSRIVPSPPSGHDLHRLFVSAEGGQIHMRAAGKSGDLPPLVCFHMSPRSSAYYEPLMSELAGRRQVFAPDTPGYGESFKPNRRSEVSDYARILSSAIDALGFETVDVLGDHTGTKIAIELADQRPDLVRRIVMNTAGVYSAEEQQAWQGRMGTIEPQPDGSHHAALWDRYQNLNKGKLSADQIAGRYFETVRAGPCMWWGPRAANLYDLGAVLPDIDQEILLVCSEEDTLIAPTRRGAGLLNKGTYREYAGFGNAMLEDHVPEIARDIDAFLSR